MNLKKLKGKEINKLIAESMGLRIVSDNSMKDIEGIMLHVVNIERQIFEAWCVRFKDYCKETKSVKLHSPVRNVSSTSISKAVSLSFLMALGAI